MAKKAEVVEQLPAESFTIEPEGEPPPPESPSEAPEQTHLALFVTLSERMWEKYGHDEYGNPRTTPRLLGDFRVALDQVKKDFHL